MAAVSSIVALTAAAAGAASSIDQAKAQERAAKRQKKAGELARRQQEVERQEAARQRFREERVRRAQLTAAAEASGVADGSGLTGALAAQQTALSRADAFSNQQAASADAQSALLQRAQNTLDRSAFNAALVGAGTSIFQGASDSGIFDRAPEIPATTIKSASESSIVTPQTGAPIFTNTGQMVS